MRGIRLFLSMVIDGDEHTKYVGHTHNDKLSIEVMVDGNYITRDPGNFVYTSSPLLRNRFRSVQAHNCPHFREEEQNIFKGIFDMQRRAHARLVYCNKDMIVAAVKYGDVHHIREVQLSDRSIIVRDYANLPFEVHFDNKEYAVGYGEMR